MEKPSNETVGIYVCLDSLLIHFGENHISLRMIWPLFGLKSIEDAKAFTQQFGCAPDELFEFRDSLPWGWKYEPHLMVDFISQLKSHNRLPA